ncbi:MAG: TIGR00725 family protein [Acidobacteriota bacterium]|nr:TIGR00725 family protein [Acidobacteriota bacterium]
MRPRIAAGPLRTHRGVRPQGLCDATATLASVSSPGSRRQPHGSVPHVGVIGPGGAAAAGGLDPALRAAAEEVGSLLAGAGATLVCGGLGGVMEAACRGAAEHDGICVGILPGEDRAAGNRHLTVALATGMGELRNALVVRCSDVLIAVGGSWGTLSEVALALRMDRPVVSLGTWLVEGEDHPALHRAGSAGEAVGTALALAARPG